MCQLKLARPIELAHRDSVHQLAADRAGFRAMTDRRVVFQSAARAAGPEVTGLTSHRVAARY